MRPTGRLHIGHYFGALQNWVKMQEQYDCFYFVADWHALTSDYADTSQVAQNTIEIGIDWLAAGLDPAKCTLFVQSQVPEHAELHLLLSMVTPLSWLERVPTYKEQLENVQDKDLHTYGFLGYPLLQTADIVMYGRPGADLFVPVGEDQAPHVEMSREIVRRFNAAFGKPDWSNAPQDAERELSRIRALSQPAVPIQPDPADDPLAIALKESGLRSARPHQILVKWLRTLPLDERLSRLSNTGVPLVRLLVEPSVYLTATPRLPGTDGRKMSKSYNNYVMLSEEDDSIRSKVRNMMTDPARKRRTDKGNPEVCPVFAWHKLFSPPETVSWADHGCRTAGIGCIECKGAMADNLVKWIEPIRARRREYEAHPARVLEILDAGSAKAQATARETMGRVREAVLGSDALRKEILSGAATKPSAAGS
jgi:tryptophanyl-tRNA synthetase